MAGILKVDTIQNANADNIITQTNSTTLTIGASGDTVTLAAGATSSGFGATYNGAVNWDTTAKTTTVTAASGVGYFINTTSGAVTVNLPAGTAGAIVALSDYAGTWQTNNVTVNANGTEKIGGVASAPVTLNTKGQAVNFVYVDSTRGWVNTGDATYIAGNTFVAATGGTITTCGDYKIHSFTGPGTFTVTNAGSPAGSTTVDYLVVAGGGGGGGGAIDSSGGGGGGAGGYRESKATGAPWTASPLASSTSLPVSATDYPITVGGGGAGGKSPSTGVSGNNSVFSTITSTGGGGGGGNKPTPGSTEMNGLPGGSGGGGGAQNSENVPAGSGNTPPVSPSQGNSGSPSNSTSAPNYGSGGGGGAGAVSPTSATPTVGAPGGAGVTTSISGSPTAYAGGGGGSTYQGGTPGSGGSGGGGAGNFSPNFPSSPVISGVAGTTNRGGGGGGMSQAGTGGAGGSGIVVIRYKFQ
jgi:hypothetical protein